MCIGVALVIDGITGLLKDAATLDIGQSFLDIYITLLGVIAVILESPKAAIPYATKVRRFLSSNMSFLQFVTGRGFTYFLAGTLELNQVSVDSTQVEKGMNEWSMYVYIECSCVEF